VAGIFQRSRPAHGAGKRGIAEPRRGARLNNKPGA